MDFAITEKGKAMTEVQEAILKSYARNDMSVNATAIELHYNRGNVKYHLTKIKKDTGLDPRKFYDLCKLLFPTLGGDIE